MPTNSKNLVWIDLEMTGLDPETHKVIEIATIVTDGELNVLSEGPVLAVNQPESELAKMDEWCVRTHTRNGLLKRAKKSNLKEKEAADQTITFLSQWVKKGESPICGSSVGQDRRFLVKHMPELNDYFHYRCIDVSTIRELISRWKPDVLDKADRKSGSHLALEDIRGSISELRYYRQAVFTI